MTLYNFFTESVYETEVDKMEYLKDCYKELESKCNDVRLIKQTFEGVEVIDKLLIKKNKVSFQLIGQIFDLDTTMGSTTLGVIFQDYIEYTWFNARHPCENNINDINNKRSIKFKILNEQQ